MSRDENDNKDNKDNDVTINRNASVTFENLNTPSTALARIRTTALIALQTFLVVYAVAISGIFTMFAIRRANGKVPLAVLYGISSFLMNVFSALFFANRVKQFLYGVYNERVHKKKLLALFSFAFFSAAATTTAGVQVAHDATKRLKFPTLQMIATLLFCFYTATTRFVGAYGLPERILTSKTNCDLNKAVGIFVALMSLLLIPMWSALTQDGIEKLDPHLSKKYLTGYTFAALLSNPLFYAVSCFDAPKNMVKLGKEIYARLHTLKTAIAAMFFVICGVASGSGYSKEMATMLATSFGSVFNEIISDRDIQEVYKPIYAAYITMLIVGMVNMNGTAGFFVNCFETERKYHLSFMRAILVYLGFSKVKGEATLPLARSQSSVADQLGSTDVFEPSSPFLSQVGGCFKNAITSCCSLFRRQPVVAERSSGSSVAETTATPA